VGLAAVAIGVVIVGVIALSGDREQADGLTVAGTATTGKNKFFGPPSATINTIYGGIVLTNSAEVSIRLSNASFIQTTGPVEVVGWRVLRPSENDYASLLTSCGAFPPSAWRTYPVDGFTVAAGERINLIVAIRSPEVAEVRGLLLKYHQGVRERQMEAHFHATFEDEPDDSCVPVHP